MTVPPPPPPAHAAPQPPVGAESALLPGDAGVSARLRRRTAMAGVAPVTVGVVLAVTGWVLPGWLIGPVGAAVGVLLLILVAAAAGVLFRRAGLWAAAEAAATQWAERWSGDAAHAAPDGWVTAVCGAPAPLHAGRGAIPMFRRARRLPAVVLPLRAVSGPLAAGDAVVVHARRDGATPAHGDRLQVQALRPRGPILIGRLEDGAVFAADRWTVGAG